MLVIGMILAIVIGVSNNSNRRNEITLTELVNDINNPTERTRIDSIERSETKLKITYEDDTVKESRVDANVENLPQLLESHGADPDKVQAVNFEYKEGSGLGPWLTLLTGLLPLILIAGFLYLMVRQAQGSNNQAMQFGRSRARMFTGDQSNVTFDDVAGEDEAKEELKEVVEFLKEPEKFIQLGARIPKGVLLIGSPGTGKTLLAKAVAGEAGVPFFGISGSEFVEMFVGVGASRVRDLFDQAKRHSPCIIFIDEIDAVGRQRGAGLGGSHDEREQTLNQILVEMDGFDTDTNIIIVAATNRPDILDPALMRPGRFDRRVVLDRPDMRGREAILKVHTRGKPLAADVDISVIAKSTPGFVGADIANLVNEAAILAARKNKKSISQRDFEEATERVVLGPERKSRIISEREKQVVAYHEAGHAVVGHMLPKCDPVRKITIVARGMSGGTTWYMPEEDSMLNTRTELIHRIASALGGRAAEELVFGEITNGAASDLEHVTRIARTMITRWGMSAKLGPRVFGQREELIFLGREISEQRDYGESVAQTIDEEVHEIVTEQYQLAMHVLRENRSKLDLIANRLLEVETIGQEEFLDLIGERPKSEPSMSLPSASPRSVPTPERGSDIPPKMGAAPSPA
ncbi:MAG: ATP-dependent zinc metalloprotease FtsH [Chloroflexi bacterium]|nr:ATP-dependent zinc metalloprotease FtsH [Chloroflexota bacterium]NOG65624.1 ATP-dependent zinc metalloprotease FtsH [Chloroflexota bacterium]